MSRAVEQRDGRLAAVGKDDARRRAGRIEVLDGDGHADATKDNRRVAGTRVAGMPGGPRVQLSSGASMPLLGLGTWEAPAAEVGAAAVEVGCW